MHSAPRAFSGQVPIGSGLSGRVHKGGISHRRVPARNNRGGGGGGVRGGALVALGRGSEEAAKDVGTLGVCNHVRVGEKHRRVAVWDAIVFQVEAA
eukprot:scaffold72308_cov27-Tisochrysis_lutea.AAC.3